MLPRELQYPHYAQRIIGYIEHRIRVSGNHGRLGAGIADKFDSIRQVCEIFWVPHVAVNKRNAMFREPFQVRFTSAAHKIVHDYHAVVLIAHSYRKLRADKSRAARYQNMHVVTLRPNNLG
jgi:hypothetical protein